ncbi:hypothetical protein KR093_007747 [Drosophila rubida]|uniref:MADF domain-containing protein n=1 Tax=Drosophila rubida TaxID=30044 RepID=A0AAD4K0U8_9MUSC|nr:hypothetical protein KR093_007747 [Drosophila rubida]
MASNRAAKRPFRFTEERHLKFVELLGREPSLWNNLPQSQGIRNEAHKRIQSGLNSGVQRNETPVTLVGVKIKIKNLRTVYHQELKKIYSNPAYKPKISWFAPLHDFLAPYQDTPALVSSLPQKRLRIKLPRIKTIKQPPFDDEQESPVKLHPRPAAQVLKPKTGSSLPAPLPAPPSLPVVTIPPQASDATAPQIPKFSENCSMLQSLGSNEFAFFGLSVGAQLSNMPLSNAMIMQSKIQYMLSVERRKIDGDASEVNMLS